MSRYIHAVEPLLPPLRFLDERMFHLRTGKSLYTVPEDPMVLLFLDANHELILPGRPPLRISTGDIAVFPARLPRVYRRYPRYPKSSKLITNPQADSTDAGGVSHLHLLRVLFQFPEDNDNTAAASLSKTNGINTVTTPIRQFMSEFRHLPGAITPAVHERITEFRREVETCAPGYDLKVSLIWLDFILECIRTSATTASSVIPEKQTDRADILVQRIKQFLVENHASALTLDEIAWQAKLSREHVARTFRQRTGQTVFDYLVQVRLEAAQQLLADSALPINEIARRIGFSSPTLFGRVFKRHIGQTPQDYRQEVLAQVQFRPSIMI